MHTIWINFFTFQSFTDAIAAMSMILIKQKNGPINVKIRN